MTAPEGGGPAEWPIPSAVNRARSSDPRLPQHAILRDVMARQMRVFELMASHPGRKGFSVRRIAIIAAGAPAA